MFLFAGTCKDQIHPDVPTIDKAANSHSQAKAPPEQVLDAAAACFMEKSYAGASLDDVARHMGATKGRIYHYFASKSDLMQAVRKRAMDINFAAIAPGYTSDQAPVERFRQMAHAHVLNMIEERAYQRSLFDSLQVHLTQGTSPEKTPVMEEFIADRRAFENMFREVLEAGQISKDFDIKTVSYALHTVLTMLNSTLYWYSPRPGETAADRGDIAREIVEMALRALGACKNEQSKGKRP